MLPYYVCIICIRDLKDRVWYKEECILPSCTQRGLWLYAEGVKHRGLCWRGFWDVLDTLPYIITNQHNPWYYQHLKLMNPSSAPQCLSYKQKRYFLAEGSNLIFSLLVWLWLILYAHLVHFVNFLFFLLNRSIQWYKIQIVHHSVSVSFLAPVCTSRIFFFSDSGCFT